MFGGGVGLVQDALYLLVNNLGSFVGVVPSAEIDHAGMGIVITVINQPELLTHAPIPDHVPADFRRLLDV